MAIHAIAPYPIPEEQRLPVNSMPWQLDPGRCALLIHDMQRYFLDPFADSKWALIERIALLRKTCEAAGIPVIFTVQPGHQDRSERGLLFDLWGSGPDARVDIPAELDPAGAMILTKRRYSAFHRTELLDLLGEHRRDQLLVCGVYAHIGCLATVLDAFMNDIQAFAVADAMGDFSLRHHMTALEHIATRCGVVITSAAVRQALERTP
ncbi:MULTISPECIES: isochorismatase family protein [Nocardia]|uniref:Isochorismatase family protein n=1 Tax=Nocardia iowensis TaxID=204891 RepID=A0ABX8RM49_NOCIO|nr:isochorismatase family protein [Nocardia iowensis]QXN90715.1 isochorismatase family protein [Nocardia iowensis]